MLTHRLPGLIDAGGGAARASKDAKVSHARPIRAGDESMTVSGGYQPENKGIRSDILTVSRG
jgi:hypothetical protein